MHELITQRRYINSRYVPFIGYFSVKTAGWSAMHVAVIGGHPKIVKLLIEHGANLSLTSKVWLFLFFFIIQEQ